MVTDSGLSLPPEDTGPESGDELEDPGDRVYWGICGQIAHNMLQGMHMAAHDAVRMNIQTDQVHAQYLVVVASLLGPALMRDVAFAAQDVMDEQAPEAGAQYRTLAVWFDAQDCGGSPSTLAIALAALARRFGKKADPLIERVAAEACYAAARQMWLGQKVERPGEATALLSRQPLPPPFGCPEAEELIAAKGYGGIVGTDDESSTAFTEEVLAMAERDYLIVTRNSSGEVVAVDLQPQFSAPLGKGAPGVRPTRAPG